MLSAQPRRRQRPKAVRKWVYRGVKQAELNGGMGVEVSEAKRTEAPRRGPYVTRKLDSLEGIRKEVLRLYKDARRGSLDTLDCYRMATVLGMAAKLLESSELEDRVNQLEKRSERKWAA